MKISTLAIHATRKSSNQTDASSPIRLATTFEHNNDEQLTYSRAKTPNRLEVENIVCSLEQANFGFAFSSGVAGIHAILQTLTAGSIVVAPLDLYHGTRTLFNQLAEKNHLSIKYMDLSVHFDPQNLKDSNADLIWLESPSNPLFNISPIKEIISIAEELDAKVAVDNTWLTPLFMNPIHLGAHYVLHSGTKYLNGHSDSLAGFVCVNEQNLAEELREIQMVSGSVLSPFDCWLITRSLKTFPLRMREQTRNAEELAHFLSKQDWIQKVYYPSLLDKKSRLIHESQSSGNGAMISFLVNGKPEQAKQLADSSSIIMNATSLGGVESLWEHRFTSEGEHSKTPKNLIRFSVGIEDIEDLKKDILEAKSKVDL